MHTVGDFVRIVVAVAAGCGLYDSIMYSIVSLRQRKYAKAMAEQVAAMNARYEELQAEAAKRKA